MINAVASADQFQAAQATGVAFQCVDLLSRCGSGEERQLLQNVRLKPVLIGLPTGEFGFLAQLNHPFRAPWIARGWGVFQILKGATEGFGKRGGGG